jgi:hypothetical protein
MWQVCIHGGGGCWKVTRFMSFIFSSTCNINIDLPLQMHLIRIENLLLQYKL